MDVIISLDKKDVKRLVRALRAHDFETSVEDVEAALNERSYFTVFDESSEYLIDAKGIYTAREEEVLRRKRTVSLRNTPIYIASPEDTLINKLTYGSEQDIRDAEGIWVRQIGKLDTGYLEDRCRALGVLEEFEEMKRRVEKYLGEIKGKEGGSKERDYTN